MQTSRQTKGLEYLNACGINLFHAFDTDSIATSISDAVPHLNLNQYPTTILVANAGYKFWQSMKDAKVEGEDPIDQYSTTIVQRYSQHFLDAEFELLYPSDYPVSLRTIGSKTGWSHDSPMGISIHPEFGLWFAYRALFMVSTPLPASQPIQLKHPCESCVDKPCQAVCPASAVTEMGAFDLDTCARFRIEDDSICGFQCLSRISCPVGAEYRYVPEQMKYHYQRSRKTMVRFFGKK